MDPRLWGMLQQHIDLEKIFLKLPLRDFFQLRGVCKDWNNLAHKRICFSDVIRKPNFVIIYPVTDPGIPFHAGMLTFHIASGQWRWKPLPVNSTQLDPLYVPFSVNGLVFSSIGDLPHVVYDAHSKRKYDIRICNMSGGFGGRPRVVAMAVDTSVTPYKFKIILGGLDTDTQISHGEDLHRFGINHIRHGRWERRSSRIPAITGKRWPSCTKSCLQYDDRVYVWWQTNTILVYSLKDDKWTALDLPENSGVGGALGAWGNRLFTVIEDGPSSVCVWELVDESKQEWRHFARIPSEMHAWLVPLADDATHVFASFCEQHVLLYTLLDRKAAKTGIAENFVLFNLETKQWDKTSLWDRTDGDTDCLEDTRRPRFGR